MSSRKTTLVHFCLVILIGLILSLPSKVIAQGTARNILQDMIEKLNPEQRDRVRDRIEQLNKLTPEEREAMREDPRMVTAMKELEDVIAYMERSGNNYGGHKGKAIEKCQDALNQLRKAIAYRDKKETNSNENRYQDRGGLVFSQSDRDIITTYFRNRTSGLPPGLAKRNGNLPPGLQKQLERNGTLPPGLQKQVQPLPSDLERRLSRLPVNYNRGLIGSDVIMLNQKTREIVDILRGIAMGVDR